MQDNNNGSNQISQDMTPGEAKASLGISTMLMGQLMPQAPQTQESAIIGENEPEGKKEPGDSPKEEKGETQEMDQLNGKFEQFKEDINKTIDDKISQLTETIKQALADEED